MATCRLTLITSRTYWGSSSKTRGLALPEQIIGRMESSDTTTDSPTLRMSPALAIYSDVNALKRLGDTNQLSGAESIWSLCSLRGCLDGRREPLKRGL